MDFKTYSSQFIIKSQEFGYSAENIQKCLDYARPLIENDLPIIYNPAHLASLVGYKLSYLRRAIVFTHFFYRHFLIRKTNGDSRSISEPLPSLKQIQLWILKNILYKLPASKFAKAYVPGTTLRQNLIFHKNQKMVLNLDVQNFFGNIRRPKVEKVFRDAGYSFLISNLLSKLCCLFECLPQGASTSPMISNLVMKDFDEHISQYCLKNKIAFTRYADDMTFSGDFDDNALIILVKKELRKLSLSLKDGKTHLMTRNQRQTVTGVVVNEKAQVSRTTRKKIRQEIYFIKKNGVEHHLKIRKSTKANYIRHLLGKVLYVLFINPEDKEFLSYKEYLNSKLDTNLQSIQ